MGGHNRRLQKTACREASRFVVLTEYVYYSGYQLKKDEIGRSCGTYGGENEYIQGFGENTWR